MAMHRGARPEEIAPPEVFYDATEAGKYLHSSRMIDVQSQMAERAIEMLCLPEDGPCMILDIGCGTGLSGETLEEDGHQWIGVDISRDMLSVAQEREVEGDLVHQDMGLGMPFREGVFDGAISISAIQWLCYSDRNGYDPRKRLLAFFQSLYKCLRRGGRAALQFYPQDAEQLQLITASAMRGGFGGGLVVDFPHSTKAKKYFLVLLAGPPDPEFAMPNALGEDGQSVAGGGPADTRRGAARNEGRQRPKKRAKKGAAIQKKGREWVMQKKESQRRAGKEVRLDSKYSARRRTGQMKF
eukprot:CAMPEP_0119096828 /NCGR_PEP_ID=MMETSP1178-20130426/174080_1 /TAXON_ID=33656 /ORGANISM="unid sp, Strain CCMP2000" /LENGTH=297 /DNA_ID=CAMNT_0007080733 /DNA_START=31 /DNA_END=924 /DNA_ORIENTATION=-